MKQPEVSITTVLYNSADCLRQCFASVEQDVCDGLAELLVVDNASPDNSAEIVKTEFPFAKLIVSKKNLGFAGGCNLSWSQANGRYWLLLNPDAVFPPSDLRKLVEWMDANPEIGAASPDIIDENGISAFPGRRFPSVSLSLLEMFRLHLLLPTHLRGKIMRGTYWKGADQKDADWIPGTAMIVRRKAIEQVGLMTEKLFMYGEDIEWCWRIRKGGWKIGVCSSVKVLHHGSTSAKQSWGASETNRRILSATCEAVKLMRGSRYSKFLLLTNSLAQLIESYHPLRPKAQRIAARHQFSQYLEVLTNKGQVNTKLTER
jgi:GT2 family glycosyltransferase